MIVIIYMLWKHHQNMLKPLPTLLPGKSTEDDSVVYVGKADTLEAAKKLADAVSGAKVFIYYGENANEYAKMVYAVKRSDLVIPVSTQYTFGKLKAESFDSKVMMRLPSHNAGVVPQ